MADKQYRTVIGIVQFEPRDAEAGGKPVRNVRIREVGFKEQAVPVSLTVWPSHKHVKLAEGDVVIAEGSYTTNSKTDDEGNKTVYHNISVSKIAVLGKADLGKKVETVSDDDEPEDDDDIPF